MGKFINKIAIICLMITIGVSYNATELNAASCRDGVSRYSDRTIKRKTVCNGSKKTVSNYNLSGKLSNRTYYTRGTKTKSVYYKNGKVTKTVYFKNGKRTKTVAKNKYGNKGTVTYYNSLGERKQLNSYDKYGKKLLKVTRYASNGNKSNIKTYYSNGSLKTYSTYYTSGSNTGDMKNKKYYKGGKMTTYSTYYTDAETPYYANNDQAVKKKITYDSRGKYDKVYYYESDEDITRYENWTNGVRSQLTTYDSRGKKLKSTYNNGSYVTKIVNHQYGGRSYRSQTSTYVNSAHKQKTVEYRHDGELYFKELYNSQGKKYREYGYKVNGAYYYNTQVTYRTSNGTIDQETEYSDDRKLVKEITKYRDNGSKWYNIYLVYGKMRVRVYDNNSTRVEYFDSASANNVSVNLDNLNNEEMAIINSYA